MKKIICVLLTFIMLCSLVACGNKAENTESTLSPEEIKSQEDEEKVKNVQKLIDELNISDASYDAEQKILKAEQAYNELDDSLKQQIDNYQTKIAKAKKLYEYYHYGEIAKSKAVSSLKSSLKNPGSYEEVYGYSIMYYDAKMENPLLVAVKITYSATNSFGGRLQDNYQVFYEITNGKLSSAKPYVDLRDRVKELGAVEVSYFDIKNS